MIRKGLLLLLPILGLYWNTSYGQHLKPGFDPKEYADMLAICFLTADTPWTKKVTPPDDARLIYRSKETGLYNRWDLWTYHGNIAVISIRGTVGNKDSWLENFHAGMIPAIGTFQLNDSTNFRYRFAKDSNAYVHAGWTLALASMADSVVAKIKDCYRQGIHDFIITGHSQGGAITFLLRSYLEYIDDPAFPKDITIKTYSSAAPKPGNLYYAYDYDFVTRNGWGFRIVNTRDWVPETPFSLQTTRDFNTPNPFMYVKKSLRKQPLLARIVLRYMYGRLDNSSKRAARRMQRVLGKRLYAMVKKTLPGYKMPPFVYSHHYSPAGVPIILAPTADYDTKFPFDGKNIFVHHAYEPYQYLLEKDFIK
ncbi:lipase family protein [Chitinophaga sp.]|uniref:lipase family protein n=1 Tax=Chitinophaga sp. TaxID=1869181 RepID=UPI0031DED767